MHPETFMEIHRQRRADLMRAADAYRLAARTKLERGPARRTLAARIRRRPALAR